MRNPGSPTARAALRVPRPFLAVAAMALLVSWNSQINPQASAGEPDPLPGSRGKGNASHEMMQSGIGDIATTAGTGIPGFSGDSGMAINASFDFPIAVAVDDSGTLFILDLKNNRFRKVDSLTGIITTVAGNGIAGYSGDGGPAVDASLKCFTGSEGGGGGAVDKDGSLFISDTFNNRVRRVERTTGVITTVAGNGEPGFSGDNGSATAASLNFPFGLAIDESGNLFVADAGSHRIRRVEAGTGIITTVAGNGEAGFGGDGGPATSASLNTAFSVATDVAGNLFIADYENRRIRRVDAHTGLITTVAGTGSFGSQGDGGLAMNASLGGITGVAVDRAGNLFLVDESLSLIRRVDAVTGIITRVAGNGEVGYSGDGGPAAEARLNFPTGVAVSPDGDLLIADKGNHVIRAVKGIAEGWGPAPHITGAEVQGKALHVYGANFDIGAELLMNGERQKKTFNDELNPATELTARKSGKKIAPGETVTLQVRNPSGTPSNEFGYRRP